GDDNDVIEGQSGSDTLLFNGSGVSESITISPNGGRAVLFRDVAAITMDFNGVENVTINVGAGNDSISLSNMAATDVNAVTVNLAATIGGSIGDAVVDVVTLNGTSGSNVITLTGSTGQVTATG